MVRRLLNMLSPQRVPLMTRQSYRHELVTALAMPVTVGLVENGFVGVLAVKAFDVGPLQLALLTAAPMFANLTSFAWAYLARGKPKVRFINLLQILLLVSAAAIAGLPLGSKWGWVLTGLVITARCLLAGIVTVRSTVWRLNYPRHVRARITGNLALLSMVIMVLTTIIAGQLLDHDVRYFRVIYGLGVVIAAVGVAAYARIRLRGERELLNDESLTTARPEAHGEGAPIYEYTPRNNATSVLSVLRADPIFRRYMFWQFISGTSFMMTVPPFIDFASRLSEQSSRPYLISVSLTMAIPTSLSMMTLPLWAKLLDKVDITHFRVRQSYFWISAQVLTWLGGVAGNLAMLGLGRALLGIAQGGGNLAWNLGHNDFASRRMVAAYMGAHVMLTGVRGAFAPFLGMALYAGWEPMTLPLGIEVSGFAGLGPHVFGVAGLLTTVGAVGFWSMARRRPRDATEVADQPA